ncbi:catechol 2,3-dioxygenase [Spirosomataceae bacterium TFI 002]|nr:catechol 2,3-dioxygenase [Spirosomataceae bacterium TFI 002]
MHRNQFIKTILGTSILASLDSFSTFSQPISNTMKEQQHSERFATFGAIHLNITNLEKTTQFWTKIAGLKLRKTNDKSAEFGSESQTLVVVHETAKTNFQKGYSGLYHFAIHLPNKAAFASIMYRLIALKYPHSPVDHTMSKSIYLDDPDGINIEFTLETPERFKRIVAEGGLRIEGSDGKVRSASDYLNVNEVMAELEDKDINKTISNDSYIGHLHLYANNVANSNTFFQNIGFNSFNYLPQFMYADLGAGGAYQHRIALNSWHGMNRPLAPSESAGLKNFHINFTSKEKLNKALQGVSSYEETESGFWINDPTGNKILLTNS